MDNTQPTRRSALGIIATGPIALLPALAVMQCSAKADASNLPAWENALASYRAAISKQAAFKRDFMEPANARLDLLTNPDERMRYVPEYRRIEDRWGSLAIASYRSAQELWETPAPDAAAFQIKLTALEREYGEGDDVPWEDMSWIQVDARALMEGR